MSNEKEKESRDEQEQKSYFKTAVDFVGEDWLKSECDKYYNNPDRDSHAEIPTIASQYHTTSIALGIGDQEIPDEYQLDGSKDEIDFLNLGRWLEQLSDPIIIDTEGNETGDSLADEFKDGIRGEEGDYEKALFELQIGAYYASQGHEIQFVRERGAGQKKERSTDIILNHPDTEIHIECKSLDILPGEAQTRSSNIQLLITKTTKYIPHHQYIALWEIDRPPTREDVEDVTKELRDVSLDQTTLKFPFGKLHLFQFLHDGILSLPTGDADAIESQNKFYDFYIRPVIEPELNIDRPEAKPAQLFAELSSGNITTWENTKWIGIEHDYTKDIVNQVENQFNNLSGKFEKRNINILHLNIPDFANISEERQKEVCRAVGRKLKINRRITSTVLSAQHYESDGSSIGYYHEAIWIPHFDPYVELPSDLPPENVYVLDEPP